MKKYTLSDSDMLGINEGIDNSNSAPDVIFHSIMGTWNAIFAQEGTTFSEYVDKHGSIDPTAFGIPEDQKLEIAERMRKRLLALNISPIGITNALIDFTVQYGPSQYKPDDFPMGEFAHGTQEILPLPTIKPDGSDLIELNDFPYEVHKPRA